MTIAFFVYTYILSGNSDHFPINLGVSMILFMLAGSKQLFYEDSNAYNIICR
jgi:hypothetical protein